MKRIDAWLCGTPRRACLALFVLFLLLFMAVSKPFNILLIPPAGLVLGERAQDLAEWLQPQGGEYVLPADSRDGLALLREHRVAYFWVSAGLLEHSLVVGRLKDSAVPSLLDRRAADRLFYRVEPLPPGCRAIGEHGALRLARCD